ncbi:hypothetical protein [Geomicrobium sp. JCM 19038]|uniref:hypothetical protein n=1 Tax=Geomicrobium sp. JCM 19038 TaxID=1460635 RepID=UPI00045F3E07|nr:hypothetical protein [Geomicrobium sp. JCM 19038]GAK07095.1 hypothetical protein JCM19038_815 [Geomicrobium sp. JCM 19038]
MKKIHGVSIAFTFPLLLIACDGGNLEAEEVYEGDEEVVEGDDQEEEAPFTPRTEIEQLAYESDIDTLYLYMRDEDLEELYERDVDSDDRLTGIFV